MHMCHSLGILDLGVLKEYEKSHVSVEAKKTVIFKAVDFRHCMLVQLKPYPVLTSLAARNKESGTEQCIVRYHGTFALCGVRL